MLCLLYFDRKRKTLSYTQESHQWVNRNNSWPRKLWNMPLMLRDRRVDNWSKLWGILKNQWVLYMYTVLNPVKLLKNQGPVVQSVVSLTSSLRVISLTVLADSIYSILIFFAEKMWVAFALFPDNSSYSFHLITLKLGGQLDHEGVQCI